MSRKRTQRDKTIHFENTEQIPSKRSKHTETNQNKVISQ